jgi:hypothetical protein
MLPAAARYGYRQHLPSRRSSSARDAATTRRILLDGLASDVDLVEILSQLAPLHPRITQTAPELGGLLGLVARVGVHTPAGPVDGEGDLVDLGEASAVSWNQAWRPRRDRPSGGRSVPYAASAWRGGQPVLGVARPMTFRAVLV